VVSLTERLRKSIYDSNLEHKDSSCEPMVTVSMGVATLKVEKKNDFSKLISKANKVLYAVKYSWCNRLSVFGEEKNLDLQSSYILRE
jgi:PleD family two-component response regulator